MVIIVLGIFKALNTLLKMDCMIHKDVSLVKKQFFPIEGPSLFKVGEIGMVVVKHNNLLYFS